jgi:hypothetical protein
VEAISRRQSFSEKGINVMSEKEKIIVFSSREICYQSSSFFANQMADAFENLGFDVQVCEFDEHDDLDAVFQPLYGQKYRLLLDFNSTITRMVEEDGTPVLDKLDGPFFDYILDHPLFHYNCLNADLKNLNGIFLDEAQEAYVKRYYPRVKKTLTMPLGATEAVTGGTTVLVIQVVRVFPHVKTEKRFQSGTYRVTAVSFFGDVQFSVFINGQPGPS